MDKELMEFEVPLNYDENSQPFGDDDNYGLTLVFNYQEPAINICIPLDESAECYPQMSIEQFKQLEWAVRTMKKELKKRGLW